MSASIFACVLVAVVALLVAAASLMFAARAHSTSKTVLRAWETSKPAKLGAELEGLREEVLAYKRVMRAELGRIWQRMPRAPVVPHAAYARAMDDGRVVNLDDGGNAPNATLDDIDPDLAAELALQRAPDVSPGKRR